MPKQEYRWHLAWEIALNLVSSHIGPGPSSGPGGGPDISLQWTPTPVDYIADRPPSAAGNVTARSGAGRRTARAPELGRKVLEGVRL